eukprot:255642_1
MLQKKDYNGNGISEYKLIGAYTDKQEVFGELIDTLEASFLGNVKDNFNPWPLQLPVKFNSCWLPKLSEFLNSKLNKRGADDYVFSVTFRDIESDKIIIENIEQIGYTHAE